MADVCFTKIMVVSLWLIPKESPGRKDRPLVVRRVTAMARQCPGDSSVRKLLVLSGSGMESGFSMI